MTMSPAPARVLLIGMMGSGKSTVGRAIAVATGWVYVDNDVLVAEVAGAETADVAAAGGAERLHGVEAVVVRWILAMPPPLVAGIPGSAVLADDLRAELRAAGRVVWLRARLETLAARIGDGGDRPFFAGQDVGATLERLNAGRAPLYAAAAHSVVDVDDLDPQEVARRVIEGLSP
jgi:shikimate kinase